VVKDSILRLAALLFGVPYGVIAGAGTSMGKGAEYSKSFCFIPVGMSLRRWPL
jgi:hypothetical protein